ncbi:MAG: hypothetical protein ABI693_20060, partial [Bryobacteraceae bacterium]
RTGDTVMLYAVGCGHASPDVAPGQIADGQSDLTLPVRVTVGGQDATIGYKGFYPAFVGLYRIDIHIPQVAAGDQPIDLLVDGVSTGQSTFITIGN